MTPSKMTIEQLFNSQIRYEVPMFQRRYVWQEDPQWQNLWEDIEEKANFRIAEKTSHPHYLGALIVDGVKKVGNEVGRMLVIDGQQRLTTLQLLLCAFRDLAAKNNLSALEKRLSRLLENPDQDIMDKPDVEKFKVWPTTLNRDVFSQIVVARSADAISKKYPIVTLPRKRKPEARSNLVEGYFYFSRRIEGWLNEAVDRFSKSLEDCGQNLFHSLNESFFVIHLSLEDSDDAQEIFYSLNSKATPLSQSDLMRSLIFMRAEKEKENKDKIFDDYWGSLETDFWSFETKRGGRTSSRLDVGLRNFLTAKTGTVVDTRRVSEEYRQWITVVPSKYATVRDELHDLLMHCALFREYESAPVDMASTDFRRVVRDLGVSTVIPLVQFIVLEAELDLERQKTCLSMLESFVVRRAFIGDETKEYNKFFVEVIGTMKLEASQNAETALQNKLLSGSGVTRRWPSDDEIKEKIFTKDVYNSNKAVLRLVLERLELSFRGSKTENHSIDKDITIEHVLPEKWSDYWPLQGTLVPKNVVSYPSIATEELSSFVDGIRERNGKLQTLGNLTLLNRRANPAAGNYAFEKKKSEYTHSVLLLNRHFEKLSAWDEASISDRGTLLFEKFCKIWPRPA